MSGQVFLDTSPCLRIANMIREEINEILARYDVHSDAYEPDILIDAACVHLADRVIAAAEAERDRLAEKLREAVEGLQMSHDTMRRIDAREGTAPLWMDIRDLLARIGEGRG